VVEGLAQEGNGAEAQEGDGKEREAVVVEEDDQDGGGQDEEDDEGQQQDGKEDSKEDGKEDDELEVESAVAVPVQRKGRAARNAILQQGSTDSVFYHMRTHRDVQLHYSCYVAIKNRNGDPADNEEWKRELAETYEVGTCSV
jgi:hypothetical protein